MKCSRCRISSSVRGVLTLDNGAVWHVLYCPYCERIKRTGPLVLEERTSYKGSYVKMYKHKEKGGD